MATREGVQTELESPGALRLAEAYQRAVNAGIEPLAHDVYHAHRRAIDALGEAARALEVLGESRWAAAYASRASDLETQARRHIEAIVERARATQHSER